jgi:phosphomannomutase/phosphoglucomutase
LIEILFSQKGTGHKYRKILMMGNRTEIEYFPVVLLRKVSFDFEEKEFVVQPILAVFYRNVLTFRQNRLVNRVNSAFNHSMQNFQLGIYRNDGILGLVESELNESLYESWGQSLARMLPTGSTFLVTSDHRKHSELFKAALTEGLRSGGINVIDLGRIPTDVASYGTDLISSAGSASVTGGSHSPSWNGLRWTILDCPFSLQTQIERLRNESQQHSNSSSPPEPSKPPEPSSAVYGSYRTYDLTVDWQRILLGVWYDAPATSLRIIVDPMYGNWAPLARQILEKCYPAITFESIHDEPRADFGDMIPASRCRNSLTPLCSKVVRRCADLGVAFDADAGYFSIIDNLGKPLRPEEISWIVLHYLLGPALKGEIFLHDVNCSEKIIAEGIRLGAIPRLVQNFDRFFVSKMRQTNALIGFSFDGSLYFRGVNGHRMVLFAVCWFLDFFTRLKKPLSEWRKEFPEFPITPEIRTPLVPLEEVVQRLAKKWKNKPTSTLEGVRFVVENGRVHVRSITDFAQLGFHFEADHQFGLNQIVSECCQSLEDLGHVAFFLKEGFRIDTT